ncbi:MAG: alpha/beta hydrolase [Bacteroidales bacterium]|nr:alpha/beta hydrolase [Bacteroidales bacterium]
MMKRLLTLIAAAVAMCAAAGGWQPDVLGDGFEMRYVDQPDDYSGAVRSTIVRLRSECSCGVGVLYVHGFNDYFFQADMAREFTGRCYDFYAVDLRKYGRSLLPGQRMFEVRDMREYFADIDSAVMQMRADGVHDIILMGHSTGGLTTTLYMAGHPDLPIRALVLNSPFLDWNQSKLQERVLIPVVRSLSKLARGVRIPQGGGDGYARSLLRSGEGEWDYDTTWKLSRSPAVDPSWIAAIDAAHDVVQNDPRIDVPVLLMHSDRSLKSGDPDSDYHCTDAVLDVEDIAYYGRRLGLNVTEVTVRGGLHDLVLSAPEVRGALYDYMFAWLWGTCPPTGSVY